MPTTNRHNLRTTLIVALTVDPHGPYPITLDADRFDIVCDAIGLGSLAREIGAARLGAWVDGVEGASRDWTFRVGEDGYRMTVVA